MRVGILGAGGIAKEMAKTASISFINIFEQIYAEMEGHNR